MCGNPTLFPDETFERPFEHVFASIDADTEHIEHIAPSLIDNILLHMKYKLMGFRTMVRGEKITCSLQVRVDQIHA